MPNLHPIIIRPAVANAGALTAIDMSAYENGVLVEVLAGVTTNHALYVLDINSTESADGDRVIATSSGSGRWIKTASEDLQNIVDNLSSTSTTRPLSANQGKVLNDLLSAIDSVDSVVVATTGNITLSGEQVIDGVLTSASRVLVVSQTDQTENGIYLSGAATWARATDSDTGAKILGKAVWVLQGTTNAFKTYHNTNTSAPTLGTDNITYTDDINAGDITADAITGTALDIDNININGNTISSTDTNGDINLTPDGSGNVVVPGTDVFQVGGSIPFADTAGTLTLKNVDVLDATTEATIEAAIDTLANLTSVQGQTISLSGSLTVESASLINQDLTTDADAQLNSLLLSGTGLAIGASNPFTDSGGTLTLQQIDALDATTEATIEAAIDTLANLTSIQGQSMSFSGGLTVESTAIVNQDLTTDSDTARFGKIGINAAPHATFKAFVHDATSPTSSLAYLDGFNGDYQFTVNSTSAYVVTFDINNTSLDISHNSGSRSITISPNNTTVATFDDTAIDFDQNVTISGSGTRLDIDAGSGQALINLEQDDNLSNGWNIGYTSNASNSLYIYGFENSSFLVYTNTTLALTINNTQKATFSGHISRSVEASITASTTQTQGQQPLTKDVNEISVCANANDVVTLPFAVAGLQIIVTNNGANTLQIFPASGDNLGAGVNTSETLAAGGTRMYTAYDGTNWVKP